MPSLNPGRGFEEHRRSRSPQKKQPTNVCVHNTTPIIQKKSIRVEPPNDGNMWEHRRATEWSAKETSRTDPYEFIGGRQPNPSGDVVLFPGRRREKYPEDFKDIIDARGEKVPSVGCKSPSEEKPVGADEFSFQHTPRWAYPRIDREALTKSPSPAPGRYACLPGGKQPPASAKETAAKKEIDVVRKAPNEESERIMNPLNPGPATPLGYLTFIQYRKTCDYLEAQYKKRAEEKAKEAATSVPLTPSRLQTLLSAKSCTSGVESWLETVGESSKSQPVSPSAPRTPPAINKGKAKIKIPRTPTGLTTDSSSGWPTDHLPDEMEVVYDDGYVYCQLGGCTERFYDQEELKEHRYYEHGDCWCSPCQLGFDDFEQMVSHLMESDRHIACPLCGLDFKNADIRDRHIIEGHPQPKDIDCPGCHKHFKSAGSMIGHIENGHCPSISHQQFIKLRVHASLHATQPQDPKKQTADAKIEAIAKSFGSIEAYNRLARSAGLETIKASGPKDTTAFHTTEVEEKKLSLPPELPSAIVSLEQVQGKKTGPVTVEAVQYLSHAQLIETRRLVRVMWGGSPLSRVADTYDTGCNGSPSQNPFLDSFDPERFRFTKETVICPVHNCQRQFKKGKDLRKHMVEMMHTTWKVRCPDCMKEFVSVSRLVAHFEASGSRCSIRKRHWFPRIMEIASSGLVVYGSRGVDGPMFKGKVPTHLLG